MFDAIVVRRTTAIGDDYPFDLGRLAEAMLFYRKVHLVLTRRGIEQLVRKCGPDVAIEIAANSNIDAVFVDRDLGVRNEGTGTARERHQPVTLKILGTNPGLPETQHEAVVKIFQDAIGKDGKGRRMGVRFLRYVRAFDVSKDILDAIHEDWQDERFVHRAIRRFASELAPGYRMPSDLHVSMTEVGDGYFRFDTNIDWSALRQAYKLPSGEDVEPRHFLFGMAEMREDLYIGATFGAGIAVDPLGAELMRAKCADLTTSLDNQQGKIDQFQQVVVAGLTDLRGVVNSGECSFSEFLGLLEGAQQFRDWLDTQTPDADLIRSYFSEVTKKRWLSSRPFKELRWLLPTAAGFAFLMPIADAAIIAPSAAAALSAADRFLISRLTHDWRPAAFIDTKLRPLVSRSDDGRL